MFANMALNRVAAQQCVIQVKIRVLSWPSGKARPLLSFAGKAVPRGRLLTLLLEVTVTRLQPRPWPRPPVNPTHELLDCVPICRDVKDFFEPLSPGEALAERIVLPPPELGYFDAGEVELSC
jgi:hypothetical protein